MGWLSFQMNEPVKDWFKRQYSDNKDVTVLDIAIVKRNTLYAAIKINSTNEVQAVIYLLRWSRERGYNFAYKSMSEFAGPCESECPERILKLLTPLEENDNNLWANNWRRRCYKTIEDRKKLSGEVVIKALKPVEFTNGKTFQFFKKINRRMYAGVIENNRFNSICRVRFNLRYIEYELINL